MRSRRFRSRLRRALPAVVLLLSPLAASAREVPVVEVREILRRRLETLAAGLPLQAGGEPIQAGSALARFYELRGFFPAWCDDPGVLEVAAEAVSLLGEAASHGLRPEVYHLATIEGFLRRAGEAAASAETLHPLDLAALDLLLTDAVLLYAAHLSTGYVDPASLDPEWKLSPQEVDPVSFLDRALAVGELRPGLEGLLPSAPGYGRLRRGLAELRARADDWGTVSEGPALEEGQRGERVAELRLRLLASGHLPPAPRPAPAAVAELFDAELTRAVRAFQAEHGLADDGVVGKSTLAALAVSLEERIAQVLVNLERWRWLPRELGERHLRVNVAAFELEVVEAGTVVREHRIIVGKDYTRTPVFSDQVTYLVLNPSWSVPASIARSEILPKVRSEGDYLERLGFQVIGAGGEVVDPASIDWQAITPQSLRYGFRQRPGPSNALGVVKLMFPNPFNVYLHDTPERALFARARRDFSHGCIRVESPLELAAHLLQGDPRWSPERLRAAVASGIEQTVLLAEPMPVHILYWTAWSEPSGRLAFRDDVYERDPPVLAALAAPPAPL